MNDYLVDTKFASENLINIIHNEENQLEDLSKQFEMLKKTYDILYWDFRTADGSEDFSDLQIESKFYKMAKFEKENDFMNKKAELNKLSNSILAKKHSMNSISMSLLQIAKQGISTVHGNPDNCPNGRNIGSETLKNVIWQGRNQAIHCEEGSPNQKVKDCFANLTMDNGGDFDLSIDYTQSKARIIIDLLGWNTYDNYELDMISLIG